jgi:predicted GIY-YIG superfamily endonuclease
MTPQQPHAGHVRDPRNKQDCPPPVNVPTILYRMYDKADQLLYIGITCNKERRWANHRKTSRWWRMVARKELTVFPNRIAAALAEEEAVRSEKPLHNVEYSHPEDPKVVGFTLYPSQRRKLEELADTSGKSKSAILRELIDRA